MTNAEDPRQSSGDQIDTGGGPVIQGDTNITNGDFVSRDKYQTINNNGLSYADAKEIYLDLFNNNFLELTQKAADVAIKRVNKFIDKFMLSLNY